MVPRTVKIRKFKKLGLKTLVPFKTHTLEGGTFLYQLYREVPPGGGVVTDSSSKRYYHFILRRGDRKKDFTVFDLFFSDCKKLLQFLKLPPRP